MTNGAAPAEQHLRAPHRRTDRDSGRRVRERLAVRLYRRARRVLGLLPAGPTYLVGGWFALASYWAWGAKRRIVRSNCAVVLGCREDDRRVVRLARQVYRNQTRWLLEIMRLSHTHRNRTVFDLSTEAAEDFERRWRQNGAAIIVGLHLGNNEAAAAALAHRGLPVTVVADDTAYDELYDELAAERRNWGVQLVGWRNLRGVYRVLRAGEILGLLVDWGYRADDVPVRFLGEWTTFPGGPAVLAARTGASIVPFWVVRRPDGTFDGQVRDSIHVRSTDPADIQAATQAFADALGEGVRQAPEQWCVFKPMWPADPAVRARLAAEARGDSGREATPRPVAAGTAGDERSGGTKLAPADS